jgi:hypothetical protein
MVPYDFISHAHWSASASIPRRNRPYSPAGWSIIRSSGSSSLRSFPTFREPRRSSGAFRSAIIQRSASRLSFCPVQLSLDGLCAANQSAVVDGLGCVDLPFTAGVSPNIMFTTGQARETAPAVTRRGICDYNWPDGASRGSSSMLTSGRCDGQQSGTIRSPAARSLPAVLNLLSVCNRVANVAGRPNGFVRTRSARRRD